MHYKFSGLIVTVVKLGQVLPIQILPATARLQASSLFSPPISLKIPPKARKIVALLFRIVSSFQSCNMTLTGELQYHRIVCDGVVAHDAATAHLLHTNPPTLEANTSPTNTSNDIIFYNFNRYYLGH